MSDRHPGVFFLSDKLVWPPREANHIHVLALARSLAPLVPTRVFCWTDEPRVTPDYFVPLDRATAPRAGLARKWHYMARAFATMDREAAPGSVAWVRLPSTALLALWGLRRRRRAGLRSLYDASSFLRLEVADRPDHLGTLMRGLLEESLWRRFDLVRALNEPMREYLVRHGVPPERIIVIPVGAQPQSEHWRPRGTPRRLLYMGSALAWQGLPALLGAMRILERRSPQIELSLVGPAATELAGLEVPANVRRLERVPHAQVGRLYLEHDLLVLSRPRTRLTEIVMPMKIPEAMAYGMPILATDLPAIRCSTGEDGAFLVRDAEPEVLAAAIETALADPAGR
jgi:glycosyltransferase involved in cell wall biosynthesis